MKIGRIEISAGAMMAVALLYYLDDSGVTLWVLMAGAVHEIGHCLAIWRLGCGFRVQGRSFAFRRHIRFRRAG